MHHYTSSGLRKPSTGFIDKHCPLMSLGPCDNFISLYVPWRTLVSLPGYINR